MDKGTESVRVELRGAITSGAERLSRKITLKTFAKRHLAKCGNNVVAAKLAAMRELDQDDQLKADIIDDAIDKALTWAFQKTLKMQRDVAVRDHVETWTANARMVGIAAAENARTTIETLMDYPMQCGTPLAMANKGTIINTADFYWKQGKTCIHRAVWLRSVAALLPNDTALVGMAMTREKVNELFEKAKTKVGES